MPVPYQYLPDDDPDPTRREDGAGLPTASPQPASPPQRVTEPGWADVERQLREMGGGLYDPTDLEGVIRNTTYNEPGKAVSIEQALANARANYTARNASTNDRIADSQSAEGNALYGSGTGNRTNTPGGPMAARPGGVSTPAFQNSSPQFDDPSQRLIEDYALDRFRQLQNPDANSGTALFEKYARELIDTLRGPVYSAADEAVIKTKALDTIMGEQDTTIQQWMEQLSRRGIQPSSGPALEGVRRIQEHYKTLRTQVEADFARDAISQTRNQRQQVLSTAGQLAGSENTRLNAAGTYAAMPYGLSQDAFQRNLQLVGASGNPASLVQSLLGVANANQSADYYSSQQRQQQTAGLLELLGYYLG
jgi:hypothetical protein